MGTSHLLSCPQNHDASAKQGLLYFLEPPVLTQLCTLYELDTVS